MKRIWKLSLVMLALFYGTNRAYSQAKFALGLKGGVNLASLNVSDPVASYQARTGFHAGAFALFKFSKIGLQPELLFSQQGSKIKLNTQDLNANYSYLAIPVLFKLYTVAGINLHIGPQFGYLINAKSDYDPINKVAFTSTQDVKNAYKNSDVSLNMGVGWDLPFGLVLDARYNLGLSAIGASSSPETKNQVWQFSVGYDLIKLGK